MQQVAWLPVAEQLGVSLLVAVQLVVASLAPEQLVAGLLMALHMQVAVPVAVVHHAVAWHAELCSQVASAQEGGQRAVVCRLVAVAA